MATIRNDLVGSIYVGGHVLHAGDRVPAGVRVHETLLSRSGASEVVRDQSGDVQLRATTPSVTDKPKRSPGRAKKTAESKPKGGSDADAS